MDKYSLDDERTKSTFCYILTGILKLLHPFMPFVTEEIYSMLPIKDSESIMISSYPKYDKKLVFEESDVEDIIEFIKTFRNTKQANNIPSEFKWVEEDESYLNSLSLEEKRKFLKKNEMNIRQCIGEAVPTIIMEKIASNIKEVLVNGKRIKKNSGQTRLEF